MIKRFLQGFQVRVLRDDDAGGGAGGGQTAPQPEPGKVDDTTPKYTDKQVNDLLAAKVGKEAKKEMNAFFESLGVKDAAELGEIVKAAKSPAKKDNKADDSVKTELEETRKTVGALQERADRSEAVALAMKAGVTDEAKIERVVKLALSPAYEGTIADKVKAIVTETPEFIKTGAPFGSDFKDQKQDITQTVLNQARKQAGLPERK